MMNVGLLAARAKKGPPRAPPGQSIWERLPPIIGAREGYEANFFYFS